MARRGGTETRDHAPPLLNVPALLSWGAAGGRLMAAPRMSEAISLYQSRTPRRPNKVLDLAWRFAAWRAESTRAGLTVKDLVYLTGYEN